MRTTILVAGGARGVANGWPFAHCLALDCTLQKKNSTVGERSCCMGTFADIINGMKDAIQPYAADMYELLARGLADPDHEVR